MPDADVYRFPAAPASALRLWAAILLGLLVASVTVRAADRLPRPLGEDAPAEEFAAARAWRTIVHLADTIGVRVTGTDGGRRAAAYVADRLRAIPGVEVEVQEAEGARLGRGRLRRYRTTNVLARIPGRVHDAVLVSTHWDTPPGSVGASDAAVPTAVAIEVARALAASPRLERTVLLNINGAEEQGLLGAEAFLRHPWARDVRVFVDLESAGPGGKATLFQAGPGAAWLARAYARSAPHPHGTVLGQDIFQSGAIPSSTDFEIYRDAGLVGLDIAFYEDGWSYHTTRDRSWNVEPGSVQHMGANALALVRDLASSAPPAGEGAERTPSVYYDIFGATMLAYDRRVARGIAAIVLLVAVVAIASAMRGGRAVASLAAAAGALVAVALAVAVTAAAAAIAPLLLGRPHGWFARPWLALAAYAPLALAAMLVVHWLVSRATRRLASPRDRALAAGGGAVAALAVLYAALTLAGIGSAYVLLWLVGPAAAVLAVAAWLPARAQGADAVLAAAAALPGALLSLQLLVLLLRLFVPIAGRFPTTIPFDLPIAGIVALLTALVATVPLALVHAVGRFGAAAAVSAALGLGGLAALAVVDPYDAEHPQRIQLVHRTDADGDRIELAGWDWPGIGGATGALEGARADEPGSRPDGVRLPAPPVPFPPPSLVRVAATPLAGVTRTVTLRVSREDDVYLHRLLLPAARIAGWSLGALPAASGDRIALDLLNAPPEGWTVTLELRGADPVPLELAAWRATTTPAAARVIERLPAWTTATAQAVVTGRSAW
ncbi:MAG TPA: M28 family metallopeptidase [Gemmatimonadaceae bacterium]